MNRKSQVRKMRLVALTIAPVAALLVASQTGATVNCSSPITLPNTTCGVVISKSGCYQLTNSLIATSNSGDCIQIAASSVTLEFSDAALKGTGTSSTGNGIHVLATTSAGVPITNVTVYNAGIDQFDTGVLLEASDSNIDTINSSNNNAAGIALKNVTSDTVSNVTAGSNTGYGILLISSNNNTISGGGVGSSHTAGIQLDGSNGNSLDSISSSYNMYGIDLVNQIRTRLTV
jgi:parallel beta-helix repeat protein